MHIFILMNNLQRNSYEKQGFMVDEVLNLLENEFSEEDSDDDFDGYIDSECEADKESEISEEMEAECETCTDVLVETCDEADNIAPGKQENRIFIIHFIA